MGALLNPSQSLQFKSKATFNINLLINLLQYFFQRARTSWLGPMIWLKGGSVDTHRRRCNSNTVPVN